MALALIAGVESEYPGVRVLDQTPVSLKREGLPLWAHSTLHASLLQSI